jgi:undecaprenyl-diphosphatase
MAAVMKSLDSLEIGACLRINRLSRTAFVRRFFAMISKLGDVYFWLAMGAVLLIQQGTAAIPTVAHLAATAGIGILIYKYLKEKLVRERPFITNGNIFCGTAPLDKYSFPSGHTLHAVSFTIMLAAVEPALTVITLPFTLLVAMSRVVLGLHYPSDVLVGAGIGAGLATISVSLI